MNKPPQSFVEKLRLFSRTQNYSKSRGHKHKRNKKEGWIVAVVFYILEDDYNDAKRKVTEFWRKDADLKRNHETPLWGIYFFRYIKLLLYVFRQISEIVHDKRS